MRSRRFTWSKSARAIVMAIAALVAIFPARAADAPGVVAELERAEVFEGDSVRYRVTVVNVSGDVQPVLPSVPGVKVEFLGSQDQSSIRLEVINGRRRDSSRFLRIHDYQLTPERAGEYSISAPSIDSNGSRIKGSALTLRVVPPREQGAVQLETTTDPSRVFPLQPFTVHLTIRMESLPAPFSDRDPMALRQAANLTIPWVGENGLLDGLEAESNWEEWLRPYQRSDGTGFVVNQIRGRGTVSLLDQRVLTFRFPGEKVRRAGPDGVERWVWEYSIERTFLATRPGVFSFGPASLKGMFATSLDSRTRRMRGENLFVRSRAAEVVVKDLPQEGRPESFTGAIGNFHVDATLTPTKSRVGDPLTLVLTVEGKGLLSSMSPPELENVNAIRERFRVYEATSASGADQRSFTYSLRPNQAGNEPFPPIPVSFFDVNQEQYVTLRTDPIPLEVQPADALSESAIVSASRPSESPAIATSKQIGLLPDAAGMGLLVDQRPRPALWLGIWAGSIVVYVGVHFAATLRRCFASPSKRRPRLARLHAAKSARQAIERISMGDPRQGFEMLRAAVVAIVASAVHEEDFEGWTQREVREHLDQLDVDSATISRVEELLLTCDEAMYSPASTKSGAMAAHAREVVDEIIAAMQSREASGS